MHSFPAFKKSLVENVIVLLLLLGVGSMVALFLLVFRVLYTQHITYAFMIWNLFLAWIPMCFALLTFWLQHTQKSRWLIGISGALWLLFFPNALYIITDFIHIYDLGYNGGAPVWFDMILITGFTLNSLLLGYISLYIIETAIRKNSGYVIAYTSSAFFLFLSSFGIYLGRFIRWNSWNIITHPFQLLEDIFSIALNPFAHPQTVVFTLSFWAVIFVGYVVLRVLMNIHSLFSAFVNEDIQQQK